MLEEPKLTWEKLNSGRKEEKWYHSSWEVYRVKVPNGWLILIRGAGEGGDGVTFYPDSDHKWSGGSLP